MRAIDEAGNLIHPCPRRAARVAAGIAGRLDGAAAKADPFDGSREA